MARFAHKRKLSLEDGTPTDDIVATITDPEVVSDEPKVEVAIDDGVDGALLDGIEELNKVEELEASIDAGVEAVEEGEELTEVMESIFQQGGLNTSGAVIFSLHMQSLERRTGIKNVRPSLESFGATSTRTGSTARALEGLKEWVASAYEKLIEGLKAIWKFIVGTYNKFFDASTKIVNAAKAMKAKVEGLKGSPSEAQYENKNIASKLGLSSGTDTGTAIVDSFKNVNAALTIAADKKVPLAAKISNELKNFADKIKDDDVSSVGKNLKTLTDQLSGDGTETNDSNKYEIPENGSLYIIQADLPGNKAFAFLSSKVD